MNDRESAPIVHWWCRYKRLGGNWYQFCHDELDDAGIKAGDLVEVERMITCLSCLGGIDKFLEDERQRDTRTRLHWEIEWLVGHA